MPDAHVEAVGSCSSGGRRPWWPARTAGGRGDRCWHVPGEGAGTSTRNTNTPAGHTTRSHSAQDPGRSSGALCAGAGTLGGMPGQELPGEPGLRHGNATAHGSLRMSCHTASCRSLQTLSSWRAGMGETLPQATPPTCSERAQRPRLIYQSVAKERGAFKSVKDR